MAKIKSPEQWIVEDKVLPQKFFERPVLEVAPDLLGKFLVSPLGEGMITEVEAYDGPNDLASHGRFGKTKRTEVMFGPAGVWYVYLIYGMYQMLNIVTGHEGYPAAVLIRSAGEWKGPGRLTKSLEIDQTVNGKRAEPRSKLWIESRGIRVRSEDIERTPRIGVDYAGEWARKPYRFLIHIGEAQ